MSKAIHTPVDRSEATVVDLANNVFRKEILRPSTIKYKGRQKTFTPAYIKALKESFDSSAYCDTVFAQLAPDNNAHTNDVERTGGRLTGVELTDDHRLMGVFSLNERGAKAVTNSDNLVGVSARIVEGAEDADGKPIAAAMQHVLLTVNPRIRGMGQWEKVDLSDDEDDVTETLDLSAAELSATGEPEGTMAEKAEDKTKLVTVELSQEDATTLAEMLADRKEAVELAEAGTKTKAKKTPKQIAFEAMLAKKKGGKASADDSADDDEDDEEDSKEKSTKLSAEEQDAIELATATAEAANGQVIELSRQLLEARTQNEVEQLLATGLAPSIVDLARPLLAAGSSVIDLANGDQVDPGEVLREVLAEVVKLSADELAVVDLSREAGSLEGSDADVAHRAELLKAMELTSQSVY
jgi:hypothetical protein